MKYFFSIIIIFLLLIPHKQSLAQENNIPINNYLKTAAENNPQLKAKFSSYMAAMEKIPQVGTLPDPTIAFGYFLLPVETRVGPQQAKIALTQQFPWFGLLNSKEDVATQTAKAKYEVFEEAKSKLFYEVKATYYDYYFIEKAIGITQENIDILKTYKELALIKIESGEGTMVDELRVQMELNELQDRLIYLNDTKVALKIKFFNLLNTQEEPIIQLPEQLPETVTNAYQPTDLDTVLLNNHAIKRLDFMIKSWKEQESVARKSGMPRFSVGVDYTFIGNSTNPNLPPSENGKDALLFPKIGVSVPLYRRKYNAMIKEAAYQAESVAFFKTDKRNKLTTLFANLQKDIQDAERRITLYKSQQVLAKQALDILIISYTTNAKNFEEVLRMERKYLKYALEYHRALNDYHTALAFLTYLKGNTF